MIEKLEENIEKWIRSERLSYLEEEMLKAIGNGTFRSYVQEQVKSEHPLEVFATLNRLHAKNVIIPRKEADYIGVYEFGSEISYIPVFI